jgi:long-chain fatty acid transport protein
MIRSSVYHAALGGCALVALASQAHASAFGVRETSSEGIGTIFSGDASAADSAATVYNNPAGMTELQGNRVEIGAVAVFPTINFHGSATTAGVSTSGNNGNNAGRMGLVPNFYGVLDISPDLKLGIAINTPFALSVKQNAGWYGRYLGVQSAILSTNINPGIAYKVNDKISLGAGVSAQWLQATVTQGVNQSVLGAPDALVKLKGDDWGFGYNFGVLYKPLPGTQLGLTYRSKISHQLSGDVSSLRTVAPFSGVLGSGAMKIDANMPAAITAGITQTITPRLKASLSVQWTQWSTFKTVTVQTTAASIAPLQENFVDTWFTSLGASYQLNDAWTLRSGVGWDQSPVSNANREVGIPDQDRIMLGFGFGYKINEALTLDGAYAHYFAPRASINASVNNNDGNPAGATILQGTYQLSLDYVSLSLGYKF